MRYYICTTKNCNNRAINPSIGLTLCAECVKSYKPPWEHGFWGMPWGWISAAFWVALRSTQRYFGDLSNLSIDALVFMATLCVIATLAFLFKIIKLSMKTR